MWHRMRKSSRIAAQTSRYTLHCIALQHVAESFGTAWALFYSGLDRTGNRQKFEQIWADQKMVFKNQQLYSIPRSTSLVVCACAGR